MGHLMSDDYPLGREISDDVCKVIYKVLLICASKQLDDSNSLSLFLCVFARTMRVDRRKRNGANDEFIILLFYF